MVTISISVPFFALWANPFFSLGPPVCQGLGTSACLDRKLGGRCAWCDSTSSCQLYDCTMNATLPHYECPVWIRPSVPQSNCTNPETKRKDYLGIGIVLLLPVLLAVCLICFSVWCCSKGRPRFVFRFSTWILTGATTFVWVCGSVIVLLNPQISKEETFMFVFVGYVVLTEGCHGLMHYFRAADHHPHFWVVAPSTCFFAGAVVCEVVFIILFLCSATGTKTDLWLSFVTIFVGLIQAFNLCEPTHAAVSNACDPLRYIRMIMGWLLVGGIIGCVTAALIVGHNNEYLEGELHSVAILASGLNQVLQFLVPHDEEQALTTEETEEATPSLADTPPPPVGRPFKLVGINSPLLEIQYQDYRTADRRPYKLEV